MTEGDIQYALGCADALGIEVGALIGAAIDAHPGREITRQHLRAAARHIAAGRRAFVGAVLTAALLAADGPEQFD